MTTNIDETGEPQQYFKKFESPEMGEEALSDMPPQPAGVAYISGNQVIIQQTPMFLRGHRNSVAIMGPYGSIHNPSEIMHCMSLMQARAAAPPDTMGQTGNVRMVKTGSVGHYTMANIDAKDRFSLDGHLEAQQNRGLDLQCRSFLPSSEHSQYLYDPPSMSPSKSTLINRVDVSVMTENPNRQTSSSSVLAQSSQREHTALYKHESTNTSTRSLYKNESTNTDSVYDFPISTSYENLSPTYTRKTVNEANNTFPSYFVIDAPPDIPSNPMADESASVSQAQPVYSPLDKSKTDENISTPITSSRYSDCQLPTEIPCNKESSSLIPSASSSQEVEVSSKSEVAVTREAALHKDVSNVSLAKNSDSTPVQPKKSKKESLDAKREKKAAKTLAIITGAFVVCWLPFFAIALLMPVCPSCWMSDVMFSFFLWLGYFNSTLNPIIYTIFSPEFREAFKRILCGKRYKRYRPGKYR